MSGGGKLGPERSRAAVALGPGGREGRAWRRHERGRVHASPNVLDQPFENGVLCEVVRWAVLQVERVGGDAGGPHEHCVHATRQSGRTRE